MPVLISGLDFRMIQNIYAAILKILIFRSFLAGQRSKFGDFPDFLALAPPTMPGKMCN